MKKRIFQMTVMCLVGCALFSMAACSFFDGDKGAGDGKEASAGSHSKVEDLDDLTADNLLYVSVSSYDKEDSGEDIQIKIYFDKRMLCRKTGNGSATEEIALTEEQCKELQEYIADYSYTVKKQEKDYWPQTEEYPDMAVLFRYEIWFGDDEHYEKYRETGALCYPNGWNEFIERLLVY